MTEIATLGTLQDFLSDIPGAEAVIDEIRQQELYDLTVLDRVHVLDYVVTQDMLGQIVIEMAIAVEGETVLPLPGLAFISVQLGASIPGYTFIRMYLVLGNPSFLDLYDFTLALRIEQPLLKQYDLETEQVTANEFRFEVDAAFRFSSTFDLSVDLYNFTIPPFTIGETGLILGLEDARLDLGGKAISEALLDLLDEPEFNGIYAESAILYWLPQFQLPYAPFKGLRLRFEEVALTKDGISFDFDLEWVVEFEAGKFLPSTEFAGYLFGDQFGIAISHAYGRLVDNVPEEIGTEGYLQLPFWRQIVAVSFELEGDWEEERYFIAFSLAQAGDLPITLQLGAPDYTLALSNLALHGELSNDHFELEGVLGLALQFPNLALSFDTCETHFRHAPTGTEFQFELRQLNLGAIALDTASLHVITRRTSSGETELDTFYIAATLSWQDIQSRLLALELPDGFPLPPDQAEIAVRFRWQQDVLQIHFSTTLESVDALWRFLPAGYAPEVQQAQFVFDGSYDAQKERFTGAGKIALTLRLPELPLHPALDILHLHTGDEAGWIELEVAGGVQQDTAGNLQPYMTGRASNPITLDFDFPGLPQAAPPLHLALQNLAFDFKTDNAGQVKGGFTLNGDVHLRPINPAESTLPVPPVMMVYLDSLFKPLKEFQVMGMAELKAQFAGDKAQLDLTCEFTDTALELDLFDMFAGAMQSIAPPPELAETENGFDLDIDIRFDLNKITLRLGSITPGDDASQVALLLDVGLTFAGPSWDVTLELSDKQFALGLKSLSIPLDIPRFPLRLSDMDALKGGDGLWDYDGKWVNGEGKRLKERLAELGEEIKQTKARIAQLEAVTGAMPEGDAPTEMQAELRRLKQEVLPEKNEEAFLTEAKRFLIDTIFEVYNTPTMNRQTFQDFFAAYQTVMDNTIGMIYLETDLSLELSEVRVTLPFHNPADVSLEGGAQLRGFAQDSFLNPLNEMIFRMGLNAEFIYFYVEMGDEGVAIALPDVGRYTGGKISLEQFQLGYGFTKNAFKVVFAGGVTLPEQLIEDADTTDMIGAGIRLPVDSRLAFHLNLIPIVLGEVDFLLPLIEFDLDLRREGLSIPPGQGCQPQWDGLQFHAPGVLSLGMKHVRFSPFFGPLPAPNVTYSYDLTLGADGAGITYICDNYLSIFPVGLTLPIPLLADGIPFFNNLCARIRLAGFEVNFNLQRPFPSLSPLALFEVLGLLADPLMRIDPQGSLANTIRATIENATVTFPPWLMRMFPEAGLLSNQNLNYTINLGTFITIFQSVAGAVTGLLEAVSNASGDIADAIAAIQQNRPDLSPAGVLALLPPNLRRFEVEGAFVGFEASAVFLLLAPEEIADEFDRRDVLPPNNDGMRLVFEDQFDNPALPGWRMHNEGTRAAQWRVEHGELKQTSNTYRSEAPALPGTYQIATGQEFDTMIFTTVLRSDDDDGIGVMFAFRDPDNYYRFFISAQQNIWMLTKHERGGVQILYQTQQRFTVGARYHIRVDTLMETNLVSPPRGGRPRSVTGRRMRISVNGETWCDVSDARRPITQGQIGLYCWANTGARFAQVRVYEPRPIPRLQPGQPADPVAIRLLQPQLPANTPPLYDPSDPQNNLVAGEMFAAFSAQDVDALSLPSEPAAGVVVGARVKLFGSQVYRFLGYAFSDGSFALISGVDIEPLQLEVAGIHVELPLEIHGRLSLSGRAKGADSYALVEARGWGVWEPIQNAIRLEVAQETNPATLMLRSNGRFRVQGTIVAHLFDGTATISGQVDISHNHCFISGEMVYRPDVFIGGKRALDLMLATEGRIGPGFQFRLAGSGTLKVLGNTLTDIRGEVSDRGVALEAFFSTGSWGSVPLNELRMALRGMIDMSQPGLPDFLLEGETYLRLFDTGLAGTGAEISGKGGIRANDNELITYIEGSLRWQGRKWLNGRIELGAEHVSLSGHTAFTVELTPGSLPDNIQVAHLFLRADIGGQFRLSAGGGLEHCSLDVNWVLAIGLPGLKEQTLPIAMQESHINFSMPLAPRAARRITSTTEILELIHFDSAFFVPSGELIIPLPVIIPKESTRYYGYWHDITPSEGLPLTWLSNQGAESEKIFSVPTSVDMAGKVDVIDTLVDTLRNLGIPFPDAPDWVSFRIPKYVGKNHRTFYLKGDSLPLPTIMAPFITTDHALAETDEVNFLFEIPTGFDVTPPGDGSALPLQNLDFAIAIAWQDGQLGLKISSSGDSKFKPFSEIGS